VTNENLLKYLLRIPLKEIEAFIEQASRNPGLREKIILPIQTEFMKSTAISEFVDNLVQTQKKFE
jgi:hypothetical protein